MIMEPGPGFEPGICGLRVRRPAELGYPGTTVPKRGEWVYKFFHGLRVVTARSRRYAPATNPRTVAIWSLLTCILLMLSWTFI
jgi:hypothetical protein